MSSNPASMKDFILKKTSHFSFNANHLKVYKIFNRLFPLSILFHADFQNLFKQNIHNEEAGYCHMNNNEKENIIICIII